MAVITLVLASFFGGPPEQRPDQKPHDRQNAQALRARRAPAVGELAPDFTLRTLDGKSTIQRSEFHKDRPLVLILGSYT